MSTDCPQYIPDKYLREACIGNTEYLLTSSTLYWIVGSIAFSGDNAFT